MAGIRHPLLPIAFMLLAAATPAGATLDPQADCMGVYFDPGAETVCGRASPYSQLAVYVVLTGGSAPNLAAWEAGLLWEPVGDAQFLGAWTVPGCLDIAARTRTASSRSAAARDRSSCPRWSWRSGTGSTSVVPARAPC